MAKAKATIPTTATVPATKEKRKFAPFKQAEDGYLAFGSKATELSDVLDMVTTPIKGGASAMLKIPLDEFEVVKGILEAANYDVKVEPMKPKVNIKTFGGGAIVFGEPNKENNAAALVADALELKVTMTNSEKPAPMVRLTEAQLVPAIRLLEEANYHINLLE